MVRPHASSPPPKAAEPAPSPAPPTSTEVLGRILEDSRRRAFEYFRAWEIPGGGE